MSSAESFGLFVILLGIVYLVVKVNAIERRLQRIENGGSQATDPKSK